MSAVPAVTFMGQASRDTDLDPFEVHVFLIPIDTSPPLPGHNSGASGWQPGRHLRGRADVYGATHSGWAAGLARQGSTARELLPGRCPAPRPGHGGQLLLPAQTAAASTPQMGVPKGDAKTPVVSPGWTAVRADPAADCDPAGLRQKAGKGERLGGQTAAGRGTQGLSWGLPHHFTR